MIIVCNDLEGIRGPLLAGILLLVLALSGCREGDRSASRTMEDVRAEEMPEEESWDVQYVVTQVPRDSADSVPRFTVTAGYMARYARDDSTYTVLRPREEAPAEPVTVHLFDDRGDSSAVLTADRVIYYQEQRRFVARGAVEVLTRDDERLETETLEWIEEERRVRTPGFVRITTPTEQIQGYRLEADEDLDSYRLAEITGRVEVEDEG